MLEGVDPTEGVIVPLTLLVTVGVFVSVGVTVLSAVCDPVIVIVAVRVPLNVPELEDEPVGVLDTLFVMEGVHVAVPDCVLVPEELTVVVHDGVPVAVCDDVPDPVAIPVPV